MSAADLAVVVFATFVVPICGLAARSGRTQPVWGMLRSTFATNDAPYRAGAIATLEPAPPPRGIRLAAFTSYFFGQMVIVTPVALIGLAFLENPLDLVLTFSAPTGAVVAVQLLRVADRLLTNAPDVLVRARAAVTWSIAHNALLLCGLAIVASLGPSRSDDATPVVLCAAYAGASIAQALLVHFAARAIAELRARVDADADGTPALAFS